MNYYNPYINFIPYTSSVPKTGLLSGLFKFGKFNLSSILNGTQKTLGFINQAIPVVKQVSPMLQNAKTMFKVMNEFKKTDKKNNETLNNISKKNNETLNNIQQNNNITNLKEKNENEIEKNNGLTFFI